MKRWLFNVLVGVSLVLCIATGSLALRSIRTCDRFAFSVLLWRFQISSECGRFSLCIFKDDVDSNHYWQTYDAWYDDDWQLDAPGPMTRRFSLGPFAYAEGWTASWTLYVFGGKFKYRLVELPSWLPIVATGLIPAWWFPRLWKGWIGRRRIRSQLCPSCGYDIRATPDRCPECGTMPEKINSMP